MIARSIAVLVLLLGFGCNQGVSDKDLNFVEPVDAEGLLSARGGILGLGEEKKGTFVDPRNDREYEKGHISGALHMPFERLENYSDRMKGYDAYIVYGNDYNDPLAEGMSKRLIELGYKNVHTLHGGLKKWASSGHDVETGREGVFVPENISVN